MSMYDYEDFYDENSEFDSMIYELRESLRNSVKKEFKDRIDELEKELEELKQFRDEKYIFNNKYEELERELERTKQSVTEKATKMKLKEFMEIAESKAWTIDGHYEYVNEKCDKCDNKRRIHFKSPSGKDMTEECPYCTQRIYVNKVVEGTLVKLEQVEKQWGDNLEFDGVRFVYLNPDDFIRKYGKDPHDTSWIIEISQVYTGKPFSEYQFPSDLRRMYFRDEKTCQAACDFLNNQDNK